MKFWPFPLLRNHCTSAVLNEACEVLLEATSWTINENSRYKLVISCSAGTVAFWNANKYYAWGHEGCAELGSVRFEWRNEMPSRWHVRHIAKRLQQETAAKMRMQRKVDEA